MQGRQAGDWDTHSSILQISVKGQVKQGPPQRDGLYPGQTGEYGCTVDPALNPTNLLAHPGDGVLTAAWTVPSVNKRKVEPLLRWSSVIDGVYLNSQGAAGNRGWRSNGPYDITGLDLLPHRRMLPKL